MDANIISKFTAISIFHDSEGQTVFKITYMIITLE